MTSSVWRSGARLKNVIAIAAGGIESLGLGHNAVAALVTRGLAEMSRLAYALGGRRDTLAGLSGLGDLVLTCTGGLSRNRQLGIELGKGRPLDDVLDGMRMVAEGVRTTRAALDLGARHGVELPIHRADGRGDRRSQDTAVRGRGPSCSGDSDRSWTNEHRQSSARGVAAHGRNAGRADWSA